MTADVWTILRQPRWLLYLVLALLFGVVTALLGLWQWDRHQDRVERRDVIEANYFGEPQPLVEVLARGERLPSTDQWTRVSASGVYESDAQHLVRNRPHQRVFGYEVLVPFVLDDGQVLAVNRGWVQNAPTASELPEVPDAPQGQVEVQGWLRPSEPDLGRDLPAGQLASIDLPGLSEAIDQPLVGAYLVLENESPTPAERPAPQEPPDTGLRSHLAYALQWWLTVPVGLILVLVMARREAEDGDGDTGDGDTGDGPVPAAAPQRARRPKKPKKVRIWDEEDY